MEWAQEDQECQHLQLDIFMVSFLTSTGKAVSDASVMILQSKFDNTTKKTKEVLLKGKATESNGEFSFEELPVFGPLKLKISATGYKSFEQTISFQRKPEGNNGQSAPAG